MSILAASKAYSTHNPFLIEYVQKTTGPVLELGSGVFSTPLLHWLCRNRDLYTYENNPEYYHFARKFRSKFHRIRPIDKWEDLKPDKHYSIVFIDFSAKGSIKRGEMAIRFKDHADFIILHDTEPPREKEYGYDKVWKHFRYRRDWKECSTWTSVLSTFNKCPSQ